MKCDVVIQGPLYEETGDVIDQFMMQPWVNRVIVSTWKGENYSYSGDKIVFLENGDVPYAGVGNRNRQIFSSLEGLKLTETDIVIKARSDQIIYDLAMMAEFFCFKQRGMQIFTLGLYHGYPFHPRDHFFMGHRGDLLNLFSAPHDPYRGVPDYMRCMRAETWVGAHYYALYNHTVHMMLRYPDLYIHDDAPHRAAAMKIDKEMKNKLFGVFPRIKMEWPKQGLKEYHYNVGIAHSEYWYEEETNGS